MQEWRNWQTRRLQVPVVARSCGFKSHLLHFFIAARIRKTAEKPSKIKGFSRFSLLFAGREMRGFVPLLSPFCPLKILSF